MVDAFSQNEEYIQINYITFSGWTTLPYSLLMYAIRDIFKDIMNKERNKKLEYTIMVTLLGLMKMIYHRIRWVWILSIQNFIIT